MLAVTAVRSDAAPDDQQQITSVMHDLAVSYGEDDARAYIEQARKAAKVQKNIGVFDQQ